eukprot:18538-Heterococcus_DN1.PRE.2
MLAITEVVLQQHLNSKLQSMTNVADTTCYLQIAAARQAGQQLCRCAVKALTELLKLGAKRLQCTCNVLQHY